MDGAAGWNDEEILIDDEQLMDESAGNLAKEPAENRFSNELEFFDSLAKDSQSAGTPGKDEFDASPDQNQGYDAVGSLFSYLTSGVRTVAESAVTKNVVSNVPSVPNISAGAQYLRQATSTLIGGQGTDSKQLDSRRNSEVDFPQFEELEDFDEPPGWQSGHNEMDKQVMQHLIQENRQLKQALNSQKQSQPAGETDSEKDAVIKQLKEEIQLLKYETDAKAKGQKHSSFDPTTEFEDIKNLFAIHRVDLAKEDVVQLYASCYFSRDRLRVQQLKVKLFQSLADRAIRNQEMLVKATKRRSKKGGVEPSEVQVFIENKQLAQENAGLKGSVEQLCKSLQLEEEKSKLKSHKLQKLAEDLKKIKEEASSLRNQQMMLRTFQQELTQGFKSSYLYEPILLKVREYGQSKDREIEECRKAVYDKNNQISEQFMRQQQMESEFSTNLTQTKLALQKESEDQLQQIVMAKNTEIGNLFNQHKEAAEKASQLELNLQEQSELAETLQEENAAMKQQIQQQLMQGISQLDQEAKMKQLNKNAEELKGKMEEMRRQNSELTEQLMEKDSDVIQLQAEIEAKNKDFQQIEEEIDHYQVELDEKREEIQCLQEQNQKLKELASAPQDNAVGGAAESVAPAEDHEKDDKYIMQEQKYAELKAEFDSLKALYEVARMGGAPQDPIPGTNQQSSGTLEPSVLRSFPEIPLLNLGVVEARKEAQSKQQEKTKVVEAAPINNAWEDEIDIDLDDELLGGVENNHEAHIDEDRRQPTAQETSPTLPAPPTDKQPSSSLSNSVRGEEEDPDFKRMRTALNADHLTMLMNEIEGANQESAQTDTYFTELKKEKRRQAKKIQQELDTYLLQGQEEGYGSPTSILKAPGKSATRKERTVEKQNLSSVKEVINYNGTKGAETTDWIQEVDEFLLYQENNEEPKVMFVGEKEPDEPPQGKPKVARKVKRQPSISLPSSPHAQAGKPGEPEEEDAMELGVYALDTGRKSFQAPAKDSLSEDEMQTKQSIVETYEGMLSELPPKDREIVEGTNSEAKNITAVKNHEQQLLLEKLMNDNLEQVPTPTQLSKAKELKDEYRQQKQNLNVNAFQKDMDNDFSSSRFPDSVKNPILQQDSNFNFQQDPVLEGLASIDDSMTHLNSGEGESSKVADNGQKQHRANHQASNSLHQRHAEIINDTELRFERMNSAEKGQIAASPLIQSPANGKQNQTFEGMQLDPVQASASAEKKHKMVSKPFTPDHKSAPFTAQIGDVHLNTAVLVNQKQPLEGPEQILSDLDEDILPEDSSPHKMGQASPVSKGLDSSGPVQPEIEVIVEADECEEDNDDDQSKQLNDQRASVPSSLKSKSAQKEQNPFGTESSQLDDASPETESKTTSNLTNPRKSQLNKPKLEIDIDEAENGTRIGVNKDIGVVQQTHSQEFETKAEDDQSSQNQETSHQEGSSKVQEGEDGREPDQAVKTDMQDHAQMQPNQTTKELAKPSQPTTENVSELPAPVAPPAANDTFAQNQQLQQPLVEEEISEKSPGYIAPSDDAPISRIELNDGDYQNIIQYTEVLSKDTSQISRPKSNTEQIKLSNHNAHNNGRNQVDKRRSFQIDATSTCGVPQEEQLNQIQTDIQRKEKLEKAAQNYTIPRIPGTAREQLLNPIKLSGHHHSNIQINQTISSIQSINSDDKFDIVHNKPHKAGMMNMHGHSQSQQIKMPDSKSNQDMQFINPVKSPTRGQKGNAKGHQQTNTIAKKNENQNAIVEDFGQEEADKNVNVNFGMFSESLEEVDDQYKESEFYSPLKQSKNDMTSMTSSVANSNFGLSPSRLQQTMNKLIKQKILDESQTRPNGQEQECIFSELEGESQLSSMVGLSPKGDHAFFLKQTQPMMKNANNTINQIHNMPKLNLDQTRLISQDQPLGQHLPQSAKEDFETDQAMPAIQKDTQTYSSLTGLVKTVTTEKQKNQEVVDKIDEVQKEMREKRETLIEGDECLDDKDGEANVEQKPADISLDLDDLEDLNNEAFGDLQAPKNDDQQAANLTPEKINDFANAFADSGQKPTDPLSIIDFLNQEVTPEKSQGFSDAEKTINFVGLGILGEALNKLPQEKPLNASQTQKEAKTGWDDEDMIGDDLMHDLDISFDADKKDNAVQAETQEAAAAGAKPAETDGGWDEDEIDI